MCPGEGYGNVSGHVTSTVSEEDPTQIGRNEPFWCKWSLPG